VSGSGQELAQLDFRFRDSDGMPVEDYRFFVVAVVGGREKPSRTVADLHVGWDRTGRIKRRSTPPR